MAKYIRVINKLPSQVLKLIVFAKLVLASMTNNPRFQSPSPGLDTLDARIKDLEKVLSIGSGTDRRAAKEALREVLKHLADYVETVAEVQNGSVDLVAIAALVESSGMRLRKVGAHPRAVFAAMYGPVQGSVDLTAPSSPKRDPHEWQVSTDQVTWSALGTTRRAKTRVKGLPVGVPHHFRHRLVTKDGFSEWSDPTVMIVVK
jgi:hypothetical protein